MKKQVKIFFVVYLLLTLVALAGVFFTEKEEGIEEKVFLAMVAQGVGGEELECLKARAILTRTNLVGYEELVALASTQQVEAWFKEHAEGDAYGRIQQAIRETKGMILVFEGEVAFLPYHGSSCGMTRSAGETTEDVYSYIKSASCKNDILSPNYIEVRKYAVGEFPGEIKVVSRFESGYVDRVSVGGVTYGGEEFRKMYHLNSACFYVEYIDSGIRILTKGNGHGLGMSLNMANELAKNGNTATDILNYFFLGLRPALYEQGEVCPY